jgi:hypothetical protein
MYRDEVRVGSDEEKKKGPKRERKRLINRKDRRSDFLFFTCLITSLISFYHMHVVQAWGFPAFSFLRV